MDIDPFVLAPLLVLLYGLSELVWLVARKKAPFKRDFLQPLKNLGLIAVAATVLARVLPTAGWAIFASQLAPFQLSLEWYVWPLALIIYEFWYWVQHFAAHKVRLLWCIHAPHHAPPTINMLVGTNHHFLEGLVYFPFFLGFMPALCGIPMEIVVLISLTDQIYGSFLHISADTVKKGRYGVLENFLQTPSYHRAHHAKNLLYIDTNYNSITLFWDIVLGTRQRLEDKEPVEYGITRPLNPESLIDVQFGEFSSLWRDVKAAPGLSNKLAYLFMAPGWSHTGDDQRISQKKQALLQQ